MIKRVFLIVLDGLGIGELPDADDFNDSGTFTLKSLTVSDFFKIPFLIKMGIGNIEGLEFLAKAKSPLAGVCKFSELSKGKDSTIGHWEIGGIVSDKPQPTYPEGFPKEIIDKFSELTGRKIICNKPYSGTEVIQKYGDEHINSGALIVYPSADSVFQIAAHEDVVPLDTLYNYCNIAREILVGKHGVGRVIARPFKGEKGNFYRTENRKDFSLKPPQNTFLDILKNSGFDVISIGKIYDLFAGQGITKAYPTHSNDEGMEILSEMQDVEFNGLCFANLVDFDMKYGHRNDIDGFAKALADFDLWLEKFVSGRQEEDVLFITADHGCDPGDVSTDHTREYIPFLACGDKITNINLGTREGFSDISATVLDIFGIKSNLKGKSFFDKLNQKYYVYLLECSDNTLYCGYTDDLKKRIKAHNDGKGAKYTKARLPVKLLYSEEYKTKSQALKREYQIKKLSRKEKINLIANGEKQ